MPLIRGLIVIFLLVIVSLALALLLLSAANDDTVLVAANVAATFVAAASAVGVFLTIREMRLDRLERSQPVVLIDFVATSKSAIYCVIRNIGAGYARDLELTFDPVPLDFHDEPVTQWSFVQGPIPLAPGTEFRQMFHTGPMLFRSKSPLVFDVTATYQGDGSERYSRHYHIDLTRYVDLTLPPKTVEDHLETIAKVLDRWEREHARALQPPLNLERTRAYQQRQRREKIERTLVRIKRAAHRVLNPLHLP